MIKKKEIQNREDINELYDIISPIVGEKCWKAHFAYGEELRLEIGKKLPYNVNGMEEKFEGEWMIGVRASYWGIYSGEQEIIISDNDDLKRKQVKILENLIIESFEINVQDFSLNVKFNKGIKFYILPDINIDEKNNLSYWEIFTPNTMLVEMGPGPYWSYSRADQVKELNKLE